MISLKLKIRVFYKNDNRQKKYYFLLEEFMDFINTKKIILASKSLRRKQLLEQIGLNIEICPSNVDENQISIKNPLDYVKKLARLKACNIASLYPGAWIIGADTIVVIDDEILGKPGTKDNAINMLSKLNNREHLVYTGFSICNSNPDFRSVKSSAKPFEFVKSVQTKVYFKNLSGHEINWYADTKEPYDKAGGYGIQGIGSFIVKKISGSYTNVVGLPVCEVVEELINLNLIEFKILK